MDRSWIDRKEILIFVPSPTRGKKFNDPEVHVGTRNTRASRRCNYSFAYLKEEIERGDVSLFAQFLRVIKTRLGAAVHDLFPRKGSAIMKGRLALKNIPRLRAVYCRAISLRVKESRKRN